MVFVNCGVYGCPNLATFYCFRCNLNICGRHVQAGKCVYCKQKVIPLNERTMAKILRYKQRWDSKRRSRGGISGAAKVGLIWVAILVTVIVIVALVLISMTSHFP